MGFLSDFKAFALKGNLADLAIGVVIGAAFGAVVKAFIDGCILPFVGLISGKDFSNLYVGLNDASKAIQAAGGTLAEAQKAGPVMAYGAFISALINFLIIAMVCFIVIKNLLKKDPNEVPPTPANEVLLGEIRDLLKK